MNTLQLDLLQRDWIDRALAVVRLKLAGRTFCSDDVHEIVEPPAHAGWWGCLMARVRNEAVEFGRIKSKRPEANGRKVNCYILK